MKESLMKAIEAIAAGERVLAFDDAGKLQPAPVTRTYAHPHRPVFDLNGTRVTAEHPFLTADGSFQAIGRVRPGARLVRGDGTKVSFAGLSALPGLHTVYGRTAML